MGGSILQHAVYVLSFLAGTKASAAHRTWQGAHGGCLWEPVPSSQVLGAPRSCKVDGALEAQWVPAHWPSHLSHFKADRTILELFRRSCAGLCWCTEIGEPWSALLPSTSAGLHWNMPLKSQGPCCWAGGVMMGTSVRHGARCTGSLMVAPPSAMACALSGMLLCNASAMTLSEISSPFSSLSEFGPGWLASPTLCPR